ncbi:DNA-binding transcriptional LysR family regulator [Pacificibacter maritimus]|uniref:DNA-binding transcriptional LysR family regulator n=1 Tax=Pacificibacter maritimus TaxID=762213 RepID=A0A3N4USX5_9RHOB|nr:LysR family transcriptional regulator [Pacificibacter maritimus]RPE64790.1 DNA-binding transcriptional LysR family regulator [Pacificibacter maritimus]
MKRSYDLPSLGDLACFEATARHMSFKRASSELNVTPAAVSHRIKALELDLGQLLFERKYRGVELTEAGALLFVATQRGFSTISDCVSRLRHRQDRTGVSIAASTAVNGLWLTPRLAAFWGEHPDISISQVVQETGGSMGTDLSICYGDPGLEDDETRVLFKGKILALGTEKFSEKHDITDISDLRNAPLIHAQAGDQRWIGWTEWFDQLGSGPPIGPEYWLNNYMISVRAAEDHIGAVLGWQNLLEGYLETGRLMRLVPDEIDDLWPFYLRIHSGASANALLFADWLVDECALRAP